MKNLRQPILLVNFAEHNIKKTALNETTENHKLNYKPRECLA